MTQGRLEDVERFLATAQGAARRATSLTSRLLAFSRRQALDPKPTNLNLLVGGMEELIGRTVGPAISVDVVAAVDLWTTVVDPPQLEAALLNLCINARDAMPAGGQITIETSNSCLDDRGAQRHALAAGQYVWLCVTDTGTGMTSDVRAKAFEPFFTTKPVGQGTGLGLSMVYGFAKQSGGNAQINSEVGRGTKVCIFLPRHDRSALDQRDLPAAAGAAPARAGETVLVVDDEPAMRMLVTEALEDLGYIVIEASDGAVALRVLESGTRIDLLLTDLGLPGGMNGRHLADIGRDAHSSLKVLFITGYAERAIISNGHLDRSMEILFKPFSLDVLATRVREILDMPRETETTFPAS